MLKEISETENVLSEVQKNRNESLDLLDLIDKKISIRNNLIDNINKDLTKVDYNINELELQINALNSDILKLKREYANVIWKSYLNRQKINQFMYILSASNFNQAYRRLKYLKQYSGYRKRQIKAIQDVQLDLTKKITELDLQKSEKTQLLSKVESENKSLSKEQDEKKVLVNNLKKKEKELLSKIRENNRAADKLKNEIERLIRKEIEDNNSRIARKSKSKASKSTKETYASKSSSSVISSLTPEDLALSNSFKENKGKLPWPTERGIITGYFGERHHPVYKTLVIRNYGIDISTVEGSEVRAVFDGEVRGVIPILGANYSLLVRHGNYYTLYTNIIDVKVKSGDKVKTKQLLGRVFTDRLSNATILHIELYENLNRLDPQVWLSKN
jgi:septal ring factor EnvC (AmiA/AmiB activator)